MAHVEIGTFFQGSTTKYRVMVFDVTSTKTTKITTKINQNKNKAGLIINPNHETKQTRTRT
jgi:hypothetical protein